jgi:hypothetical protein
MNFAEAEFLIRRATAQLDLARRAALPDVSGVHLEMSSLYLERARMLIDSERQRDRRSNVIQLRR